MINWKPTGASDAANLRGKQIQVIVKLANIHLTPERPKYMGGSWHVEGMLNETIVASAIYYYGTRSAITRHGTIFSDKS